MPMTYLNDAIQETIFLEPVTLEEIKAIVSSLKNNATGFDEINAEYLKMSMAFVANPLVYICNMSLSEGVFPTQLKLPMLYLYTNVMTPCYSTIIDLFPCCVHCQKSLRRLCIIGLLNFWINSQFYMNISLDLEGNDLLI